MNSVTELKEAVLADYIQEIQKYSKDRLVQALIIIKTKEMRMAIDGKTHNKKHGGTTKSK